MSSSKETCWPFSRIAPVIVRVVGCRSSGLVMSRLVRHGDLFEYTRLGRVCSAQSYRPDDTTRLWRPPLHGRGMPPRGLPPRGAPSGPLRPPGPPLPGGPALPRQAGRREERDQDLVVTGDRIAAAASGRRPPDDVRQRAVVLDEVEVGGDEPLEPMAEVSYDRHGLE